MTLMVDSQADGLVNRLVTEPLARTHLFEAVDRLALNQIASRTVRLSFRKGDVIVTQGEPGDRMFMISEGAVQVYITSTESDGEEVVLTTLGPTDTFGELTLLDGEPRSASVRATASTVTFALGRDEIRELMRADPALAEAMLQSLSRTLRRLTDHTADAVFFSVHQRVAALILDLAREKTGGETGTLELDLRRTEHELSAVLGRSRESVAEVLHSFEQMGCLEFHGQVIHVRNPDTLRQQMGAEMTWATLANKALHDPLTRLANRRLFGDRVVSALSRSQRQGTRVAVLVLDVDDFKTVNDLHGHAIGDHLLLAVADRLRAALRISDTAARFGGDEFGVLLEDVGDATSAIDIAERIVATLAAPFDLPGATIRTGASLGMTISEVPNGAEPSELLHYADTAMYRAKQSGKGRLVVHAGQAESATV
jgi:diguanylate cyclase (GGDEF)-like protein